MKNKTNQEQSLEDRFGKQFSYLKTAIIEGDCDFEQLKAFISQEIQNERKKVVEEVIKIIDYADKSIREGKGDADFLFIYLNKKIINLIEEKL